MGLKFKILPKVGSFKFNGVRYLPGDVVDLPASYDGEAWLERVEAEVKAVALPSVVEAPAEPVLVPLEPSAKRRRIEKVARIFRR